MRAIAKDEKEIELLKLLDVLAENRALFHSKQGMSIRKRLKVLISEQRNSFVWDAKGRLVFLFRLVLSCPILLSRPPGFEWILEDFIDALHFTLLSTKYGLRSQIYEGKKTWVDINVFREAWSSAWGQLHRGTGKRSVILDYAIARDVEKLMMKEGLAFPDAVEKLAHQQSPRKRKGKREKGCECNCGKVHHLCRSEKGG